MKKLALFVVAINLVFWFASPVLASAPVVEKHDVVLNYPMSDQPCSNGEIWDYEVFTYTLTTFTDQQGNPQRISIHAVGTDNFYNPANPDLKLSGHFVHNFSVNLITGEVAEFGVPVHITVPGYGTVLVEAGRWFADGRIVGKHSFTDTSDIAQFCSILAPP